MNLYLHEHGRCSSSAEHELFFSERADDLRRAQEICSSGDVRPECLSFAVGEQVEWGVWGGVIFWDGQPMFRKRGRGRPRNDDSQIYEIGPEQLVELIARSA